MTFDVDTATAPGPAEPTVETVEGGPKRKAVLVGYGVEEEPAPTPARRRPAAVREAAPTGGTVRATPPVRKLAKQLGVDLAAVPATGPNGRVSRDDVERAADGAGAVAAGPLGGERIPVRGPRRLIAEKMSRSWQGSRTSPPS